MSFAVYGAIVHDAALQAPPTFSAANAPGRGGRVLSTTHALPCRSSTTSTTSTSSSAAGDVASTSVRYVRLTVPTPHACTSALDVPHLLPAVREQQRQALLQHRVHAPLAVLGTTRSSGNGLSAGERAALAAAHRQARVAQAYQHALSSASGTTTAAMLAMTAAGGARTCRPPLSTVVSPYEGARYGGGGGGGGEGSVGVVCAAASATAETPCGGRASLLPSGAAPRQRWRQYPPSASPGDRYGTGSATPFSAASGRASLRPPLWSASPASPDEEGAGHAQPRPAGGSAEDALEESMRMRAAGTTLLWGESPPRSPSSLRFSASSSRAWSPPSSGQAGVSARAAARVVEPYRAPWPDPAVRRDTRMWADKDREEEEDEDVAAAQSDSPLHRAGVRGTARMGVSAVTSTLSARMRVDTTQPFLSHSGGTRGGGGRGGEAATAAAAADITQPPSPMQVMLSLQDWDTPVACATPSSADCGRPCDDRLPSEGRTVGLEDEDEGYEDEDREESVGEGGRLSWRTPRGSAQRPRPSVQLRVADDERARQRHRRLAAAATSSASPTPSAQDGTQDAKYLPIPLSLAHEHAVSRGSGEDGIQYHLGRSRSVAAEPAVPAEVLTQRIVSKQRALEVMLAEMEDSLEVPRFTTSTSVDGEAETTRTTTSMRPRLDEAHSARSASWVLRSLSSRPSAPWTPLESAVDETAAPWRPTINAVRPLSSTTAGVDTLAARHPRRVTTPPPASSVAAAVVVVESPCLMDSPEVSTLTCTATRRDTDESLSPLPLAVHGGSAMSPTRLHGRRHGPPPPPPHDRSTVSTEPSLSTIARDSVPASYSGLATLLEEVSASASPVVVRDVDEAVRGVCHTTPTRAEVLASRLPWSRLRQDTQCPADAAGMVGEEEEAEEEDEESMEPVGMDEAGNIVYQRVTRDASHGTPHTTSGTHAGGQRQSSGGGSAYCPMDRTFAQHGLAMPFSSTRTGDRSAQRVEAVYSDEASVSPVTKVSSRTPPAAHRQPWPPEGVITPSSPSSLLLSPGSLLQALARTAGATRLHHNNNNNHNHTHHEEEAEDFTIRRSTVHDVLTHLLTTDHSVAGRAPLGGAPLRYQLPTSLREPSPGGEGRASSFLHVRPSTRESASTIQATTTTTTRRLLTSPSLEPQSSSREGSASFLHLRPSGFAHGDARQDALAHTPQPPLSRHRDPHVSEDGSSVRESGSGSDFLVRGSLALSTIGADVSSRGSLLSMAAFDAYATRLAGSGGEGRAEVWSEGAAGAESALPGRHSWAPRKAAPCTAAELVDVARLSYGSATTTRSSNFAVEALRFSSCAVSSQGRPSERSSLPVETDAHTEAFMAAANELAESLRAYGARSRPTPRTVPSRSPSLRAPSSSPRGAATTIASQSASASASSPRAASSVPASRMALPDLGPGTASAFSASLSPVPSARGPRHLRSGSNASGSPPVVSFRLPDDDGDDAHAPIAALTSTTTTATAPAAATTGVPPWITRLLRVQQQLQSLHRSAAVVEVDGETPDALEDAAGNDEDDGEGQRRSELAARAFERLCAGWARATQPSPDAVSVSEGRAHSGASAASWWSGSDRETRSQGSPTSTRTSSIVAGRRAILLDASLTCSSTEHDVGTAVASLASARPSAENDDAPDGVPHERLATRHANSPQEVPSVETSKARVATVPALGSLERVISAAATAAHTEHGRKENEVPANNMGAVDRGARGSGVQDCRLSLNPLL